MKILFVIASINPKNGGPIEGIRQLYVALKPYDVSVEIACCDPPEAPYIAQSPFPVVHAFGPPKLGMYSFAPGLLGWLRENGKNYDAVISNGVWQYNLFAVYLALRNGATPYFVFTHGMLDPWFKKAYPLKHLKKWLYWPWSVYPALKNARAVIFTCEEERILARQSFWLYSVKEKVTHYGTQGPPHDIDALRQDFAEKYPETQGKRILLFLSRIHEKKGCDILLKAFAQTGAQAANVHLVMAGPDQTEWGRQMKALSKSLGIENRVTWTGMLDQRQKWGAYASAEAFILPSHQENFGIVIAEALACGLPVLMSDKINIWREISAEKAGFVDTDTVEGTCKNIINWLNLSPQDNAAMKESAKACFARNFHIDQAAASLFKILKG